MYHIHAPQTFQQPETLKGKPLKVKPAKRNEVPVFYRKKRWIDKHKPYLFEIMLYIIAITERGKQLCLKWSKKDK